MDRALSMEPCESRELHATPPDQPFHYNYSAPYNDDKYYGYYWFTPGPGCLEVDWPHSSLLSVWPHSLVYLYQ